MSGPVVIVEDDASMSAALARILRLGGRQAVVFDSAEALLCACRVDGAACLILDIHLPGIDAFALHRRLCDERSPMPPVIFMTAFDDPEMRLRALRLAPIAFLTKPFAGRTLLQILDHAIGP